MTESPPLEFLKVNVNHDELWGNIEQNPTGILTVIFKPFHGLEDIKSEFSFLEPQFSVEAGKFDALQLILIGESWETHPEIFPKFQFSGV